MAHRARAGRATGGAAFGYVNRPIIGEGGRRSHVERVVEPHEAAMVARIFYARGPGMGREANREHLKTRKPRPRRCRGPAGRAVGRRRAYGRFCLATPTAG